MDGGDGGWTPGRGKVPLELLLERGGERGGEMRVETVSIDGGRRMIEGRDAEVVIDDGQEEEDDKGCSV